MAHEPNPSDVGSEPVAVVEPPAEPGGPEPAFVARARRILAGDVRPDDYLPVPDEVRAAAADFIRQVETEHGFEVTDEAKQRTLNDWTLFHHHDGVNVLARYTPHGVLVLAAGDQQIRQVNQRFDPYRRGFAPMFQSSAW